VSAIWAVLPAWLKSGIKAFSAWWAQAQVALQNPEQIPRDIALWLLGLSDSSQAKTATRLITQIIAQGANDSYAFATDTLEPIFTSVFQTIITNFNSNIFTLAQNLETDPATLETAIVTQKQLASSQVLAWATLLEFIPFINTSSVGELAKQALSAIGGDELHDRRVSAHFSAGADAIFQHEANALHLQGLPPTNVFQSLWAKGVMDLATFQKYAAQNDGLSPTNLGYLTNAARAPPSLADYIIWNLRHPDKAIPLNSVADITREDTVTFSNILNERQYADPSTLAVRTLSRLGVLPSGDIEALVARLGYRKDLLPGQTISDYDLMVQYYTLQQEVSLNTKLLASEEKLYLQGKVSATDLQTVAAKVYPDLTEQTTYMQYAANQLQAGVSEPKHFSYTQIIKFAEQGIDVAAILPGDLAATGLDPAHQNIIVQYLAKILQAKGITLPESAYPALR
jgi:hypothetical protein